VRWLKGWGGAKKNNQPKGEKMKEQIIAIQTDEFGEGFQLITSSCVYFGAANRAAYESQKTRGSLSLSNESNIGREIEVDNGHIVNLDVATLESGDLVIELPGGWEITRATIAETGSEYFYLENSARALGPIKVRISDHTAVYDCNFSISPLENRPEDLINFLREIEKKTRVIHKNNVVLSSKNGKLFVSLQDKDGLDHPLIAHLVQGDTLQILGEGIFAVKNPSPEDGIYGFVLEKKE